MPNETIRRKDPNKRVERFEDLIAWQKARALNRDLYIVSNRGRFLRDFSLTSQLRRAASSVMLNIAEGFEKAHLREFHQALNHAKGSCAEVRSALYICLDIEYIDQPTFDRLMAKAEEVARIVGGLRASIAAKLDAQ